MVWRSCSLSITGCTVASLFCIGLVAALASATVITALGGDGVIASIGVVVICAILINVLMLMYRRSADPRFAVTYVLAVVTGGALVLLASLDNHGAALLAGIAVGVVLFGWRSSRPSREAVGASS